ncbi:MAG: alanine racemase [Candidatus Polarisedimenticolia bacterium]
MAAAVTSGLLARHRPTWAEIDRDALHHNLRQVRERIGDRRILAVVKADAYGHGAVGVARSLAGAGVAMFGVALPEEGVALRRAGIDRPILLLGGITPEQAGLVAEHGFIPAVYRADQVEALDAAAARAGRPLDVHLKIDTGMGRLGVPAPDVGAFGEILARAAGVRLAGAFSHLAVADAPGDPFTAAQIERFRGAVGTLRRAGLEPVDLHLANSAAISDHPPAWLTLVRPGIVLYGYPPSDQVSPLDWLPVLSLKTRIIYLKDVAQGTSLGYGRTFVTSRPSRIASLAAGYDDGLPRDLGNRGQVLVGGRFAPIVGRISMDLTTIDVTDLPGVRLHDEVVLIGRDGGERIGADRIAAQSGRIVWEVLCGIGARVPRLYRGREGETLDSRFGCL